MRFITTGFFEVLFRVNDQTNHYHFQHKNQHDLGANHKIFKMQKSVG